jgi:hypothetical protein
MLRGDHPDDDVAIALPMFKTYESLAKRVEPTLSSSRILLLGGDLDSISTGLRP